MALITSIHIVINTVAVLSNFVSSDVGKDREFVMNSTN